MTFVDPRAGIPYNNSDPYPSAHANTVCAALPYAVDCRGGTYAQTSGLTFTGTQTTTIPKILTPDLKATFSMEAKRFHDFTGLNITYTTDASTYPIIICHSMVGDGTITLGDPAYDKQVLQIINNDLNQAITISAGPGRTIDLGSQVIGRNTPSGTVCVEVMADSTVWRVINVSGTRIGKPTVNLAQGSTLSIDSSFKYAGAAYNIPAKTGDCTVSLGLGYDGQLIYLSAGTGATYGINVASAASTLYYYNGLTKLADRSAIIRCDMTPIPNGLGQNYQCNWRTVGLY